MVSLDSSESPLSTHVARFHMIIKHTLIDTLEEENR